jgi:hypothetical protein
MASVRFLSATSAALGGIFLMWAALSGCGGGSSGSAPPTRSSTLIVANQDADSDPNLPSIGFFSPSANANARPKRLLAGDQTGLDNGNAAAAVVSNGQLYVSNPTNGNITIYPVKANGNIPPTATLGGPATMITFPAGLAVDAAGRIYVADEGPDGGGPGSILVFAAGASGNVAPLAAITPTTTPLTTPVGVTVASNGDIWVANFGGASVMKFTAGSNGDVPAAATLAGANTMIDVPSYVAIDSAGNLCVSNDGAAFTPPTTDAILIFPPGSDGNVAPSSTISGSNTQLDLPTGLVFDTKGDLFVANYSNPSAPDDPGPSLVEFGPGRSGNIFPLRFISGASTHLSRPAGMFFVP